MANPPDDNNVLFFSGFNGTDGATSLEPDEFHGATPLFSGGAEIDNDDGQPGFPYVGNAIGTSVEWNANANGGVVFNGITGSSLIAGGEFYIEFIFFNTGGQNDMAISVSNGDAGEIMFEVLFVNNGLFTIRYSLNGSSFVSSLGEVISSFNNDRIRFVAIQYVAGRLAVYYRDGVNNCNPFTASKVVDELLGAALHSSSAPLRFGFRGGATALFGQGYQNWTYVASEALYPGFPDEIDFPGCTGNDFPRNLTCAPFLKFPIPDVTIFNDEEFEKDYSYFFEAPTGVALTFSASGLPSGLSMTSKGVLSGEFTGQMEGASFTVTVTATSSACGQESDQFDITVGTVTARGSESYCTLHSGS